MTTQTNEQVVAEFYWALRAIKEATGVTPRCWRRRFYLYISFSDILFLTHCVFFFHVAPYGDVDDRVRAIAWQMGMHTVIWDEDSNDWAMPGDGGGNLSPSVVDGYFENWINARKNGSDDQTGHIVLEHELNNSTVSMAEKWLPEIQQTFNVVPVQQCMNISQPYWETSWVYPTEANPNVTASNNGTASATSSATSAASSSSATSGSNSQSLSSASQSSQPANAGSVAMIMSPLASALVLGALAVMTL